LPRFWTVLLMRMSDTIRIGISIALIAFIFLLPIQAPIIERVINPLRGPLSSYIEPLTLEEFYIDGLEGDVEIFYDEYGVPYIYGDDYLDIAYALGFLHARDRLFQMDIMRRIGQGRLSELLGEATLDMDKRFRLMGLGRAAEETFVYLSVNPEFGLEVSILEAYSEGVNAYIEWIVSRDALPPEYVLINKVPERWSPVDSISIGKFMAWSLSWSMEDLYLADIVDRWGLKAIIDLDILNRSLNLPILDSYPGGSGYSSIDEYIPPLYNTSGVFKTLQDLSTYKSIFGVGSNNWVISGSLTVDGYAYVANDPHLSLTAPPIWYVAYASFDDYTLFGFTLPGTPVFLLGTNGFVAWGFTNVGPDVTDYYFFTWDGEKYLYKGEYREVDRRVEVIRVATGEGFEEVRYTVNLTVLGPLIEYGDTRYAMRWTGDGVTLEMVAVFRYGLSRSINDIVDAAKYFHVAPQNLVAADREGNILYLPAGLYPVRNSSLLRDGDISILNTGFLPFNASRGEGLWIGYIPFNEIPRAVNPDTGYLATANNMLVRDYPRYLGWSWADRYRYERIVELIEELKPLDREDMFRIQTDRVSKAAEVFTELFGLIIDPDEFPEEYRGYYYMLLSWNHTMDSSLIEPGLYTLTLIKLHYMLWSDLLGDIPINFLSAEWTEAVLREYVDGGYILQRYVGGDPKELLRRAFMEAVDTLENIYGGIPRWGDVLRYEIRHVLGDFIPWLNYNVYPGQGGLFTVFVSGHGFGDPPYTISASQSMRAIYVVGGGGVDIYYSLPGGNSGIPFSLNYQDILPLYVGDMYIQPIPPERGDPDIVLRGGGV